MGSSTVLNSSFIHIEDGKFICVNLENLDEAFQEEYKEGDPCLKFSFQRQRFFHKKICMFQEDMIDAAVNVSGYLEYMLQLNDLILRDDHYNESNYDSLLDVIFNNLANEETYNYVVDRVESNYDIDIESGHKLADKEDACVLQFTNEYAKRVLCVGLMARLIYPLIGSFINKNNLKAKEQYLFMECMHRVLNIFNDPYKEDGECLDLATKIQRFVQVNVDNTLYSDKVIWSKLEAQNITNDIVSQDITRAIFTHIIPKLELGRSVISFLHVFIKNQIDYEFHKKFKLSYKPITRISVDEDSINPFVTIEQRLTKTNTELDNLLNSLEVRIFISKYNKLSEEELQYHCSNIVIHTAQTRILGFFVGKVISRGIPILSLNKVDYIKLLFIAIKWFEENNYTFIPFILLGSPSEVFSVKHNLGRGKNFAEIVNSKIYNDLISYYDFMGGRIDFSVIINFISELINTNFEAYTFPDGTLYVNDDTNSIKDVIYEILRFIESL